MCFFFLFLRGGQQPFSGKPGAATHRLLVGQVLLSRRWFHSSMVPVQGFQSRQLKVLQQRGFPAAPQAGEDPLPGLRVWGVGIAEPDRLPCEHLIGQHGRSLCTCPCPQQVVPGGGWMAAALQRGQGMAPQPRDLWAAGKEPG